MEIDDFIEDGGGVILLIVLAAIFLPKLIQRFRTGGFTPLIKVLDYKIGDQDSKPGTLLEIEGNRAGFGAWLLDLLGLKSRHIKVLFHKNYMEQVDGHQNYHRIPSRDGYTSKVGYSTSKILLILSLLTGFAAILSILTPSAFGFTSYYGEIMWDEVITTSFLSGILSLIFFWRYRKSTVIHVSVTTNKKYAMGLNIKPSMDKAITKEDMAKIKDALHLGINFSSRFYNNYYKN